MRENDAARFRLKNREVKRDCRFLGDLVNRFFHFLGMKPQPSETQVRKRFTELNTTWEKYCLERMLPPDTRDLFKHDVELTWNNLKDKNP